MKLLYSSHGEASEIYKLCAAKIPEAQELLNVEKTLRAASVDPRGSQVSILDRREIKALVQRSDPRYFLFLRELSVHLKRAYEPTVNSLLSAGYTPVKSLLVRLCDGASPVEILALGVLAGICGVGNLTLSLNRATLMPDTASACRLCGIERVLLCDEISAVGIAAYGTKDILPFDRMICVGSSLLCAAAGITGLTREVFIVMSGLPVVAQVTVMAGAYGADEEYAAIGTSLSMLGIFVTIPILMTIL